jgi:hypothetical protein
MIMNDGAMSTMLSPPSSPTGRRQMTVPYAAVVKCMAARRIWLAS